MIWDRCHNTLYILFRHFNFKFPKIPNTFVWFSQLKGATGIWFWILQYQNSKSLLSKTKYLVPLFIQTILANAEYQTEKETINRANRAKLPWPRIFKVVTYDINIPDLMSLGWYQLSQTLRKLYCFVAILRLNHEQIPPSDRVLQ